MSRNYSLRTELLFSLSFLAVAALLLALGMAAVLPGSALGLMAVVPPTLAAVLLIVFVGNFILRRGVLRPLEGIAKNAALIAAGETDLRVPERGAVEIVALAGALNQLTTQLLQNQSRLAENVRSLDETNQRLIETQRELVQAEKLASLGQLAAGVAHEIGNPLGAVMGYVSLQKRHGDHGEITAGLERETRRIDRIVRELLDYARPASDRSAPFHVNASVNRVVELLTAQGWLAGVSVRLQLAPTLPQVVGDPHRFDQILVNLLRNAESAMEGVGEVIITTMSEEYRPDRPIAVRRADDPPGVNYSHLRRSRRQPSITSTLQAGTQVVRITVSDTGPGIPEDEMQSIFDPFFTTKGPGQGSGLGLAIVAGTVAELGGQIDVASSPSGGATFTLWIPSWSEAE